MDKEQYILKIKTNAEKLKAEREKLKAEREKRIREYWENELPKFEKPEDVPELPRADEKEWKEFYIPKLVEHGAIPKKDLIDGQIYIGDHRRTTIAKWNAQANEFEYMRYKFGWFKDTCNHFEDDDGFALFVPIKVGTQEDWDNRLKD